MAASVNASLMSLDILHVAAGSLDTKLRRSLQQQVGMPERVAACIRDDSTV